MQSKCDLLIVFDCLFHEMFTSSHLKSQAVSVQLSPFQCTIHMTEYSRFHRISLSDWPYFFMVYTTKQHTKMAFKLQANPFQTLVSLFTLHSSTLSIQALLFKQKPSRQDVFHNSNASSPQDATTCRLQYRRMGTGESTPAGVTKCPPIDLLGA